METRGVIRKQLVKLAHVLLCFTLSAGIFSDYVNSFFCWKIAL